MDERTNWMNGRETRYLNGAARPSIVLYSEAEKHIAQQSHNLVWEKYRTEWDSVERSEIPDKEREFDAIRAKANPEIDQLIKNEIARYRAFLSDSGCSLCRRIEEMEEEIAALRTAIDDAQSAADDAQAAADDAMSKVEDLKSKTDEA